MAVVPSVSTFPDPVNSGSHMEKGRSTVKRLQARYLIPHLTVKRHGMIAGICPVLGKGLVP